MASLIASRLAKTIYDEFKIKPSSVTLWSNSRIVVHWLRSESALLKPFVGVRVTEIQSTWNAKSLGARSNRAEPSRRPKPRDSSRRNQWALEDRNCIPQKASRRMIHRWKLLHRGRPWKKKDAIPRAIFLRATCDGCNVLFKLAKIDDNHLLCFTTYSQFEGRYQKP